MGSFDWIRLLGVQPMHTIKKDKIARMGDNGKQLGRTNNRVLPHCGIVKFFLINWGLSLSCCHYPVPIFFKRLPLMNIVGTSLTSNLLPSDVSSVASPLIARSSIFLANRNPASACAILRIYREILRVTHFKPLSMA